jgi:catechol 2,3-dioxygenase-like lactoylglutathione lyase family enzyme
VPEAAFDLLRVGLRAPRGAAAAIDAFYADRLGLERLGDGAYAVGPAELSFRPDEGAPFYHFALLVPGDRFDAALEWARERVDILPGGDVDDVVFDFDNWNALAFYFHDPAGNIVELIAHRGLGDSGAQGAFGASELLGVSEVGLVGEPSVIAEALESAGIRLYDGSLEPGRLAFFGERAKVLILAPEGRGWLPTGRPAEPHPVDVVVAGAARGVDVGAHRVEPSRTIGA